MSEDEIYKAFLDIEIALLSVDNCVATDDTKAEPVDGYSWRIDNKNSFDALCKLRKILKAKEEIMEKTRNERKRQKLKDKAFKKIVKELRKIEDWHDQTSVLRAVSCYLRLALT
ncbi:hypothetical protein CPIN17260_1097 [Campylobacter pinnipediorum subsp. pinnipediorum]|uniref:hypothetical protein n=1 Tax=Campylobacter pinnipediorum TaxID=1965231 RepID=UPI0009953A08|nr:hypothetical protein [Campylobacter pinnipediorum]AQW81386.1 hypothetical protein CPIN17260_1097 [Campylobacter pinnipediorum subsp. pinnipediorum]